MSVSKLKVLKSAKGYYLGRTIKINGTEVPYDRKSEYLSKEKAENLFKKYEKELNRRINDEKKYLSVQLGIDFNSSKSQYIIAHDTSNGGIPMVLELRAKENEIKSKEKELEVFHEGKYIDKLDNLLITNRFEIIRNASEISRIYEGIEKMARENNTKEIAIGAIDYNKNLTAKKFLDLSVNDGEKERFVETAVLFYQSVIPLSHKEYNTFDIGDKITRNSFTKTLEPYGASLER